MVFLLYSVNVVNYIDGFINVTPTLFFLWKIPLGQDTVSFLYTAGFNLLKICKGFLHLC